jgi:hypothetical protein
MRFLESPLRLEVGFGWMRLRASLTFLGLLALVLPTTAAARVSLVKLTSPVHRGDYASLTVSVRPAHACSIVVTYQSGPSEAAGLGTKRPIAGKITWRWKVGSRTTPGRWPIQVKCGTSGTLKTSFVVLR